MGLLIFLFLGFIVGVVFVNVTKTGSPKPIVVSTTIGLIVGLVLI